MTNILLSTYNGEKYLHEQLDSIFNQTYTDFKLVVRDDGSTDSTIAILEEYQNTHPTRMEIVADDLGNIGVAKSFRLLMEKSNADYYLFADQDDIWELNKIEVLVQLAINSKSNNTPYVVFSNMTVIYSNSSSEYNFFKKFKLKDSKVKNGLFQGTISGCLMLFNDKAKQESLRSNLKSNMLHDWDIIMVGYLQGEIEIVDESLIKHRIHSNNAVGENLKKDTIILIKDLMKYVFKSNEYRSIVLEYYYLYVQSLQETVFESNRISKELFTEEEINKMTYLQRKKWYLKHFNPFLYGKVNGLLITLTI